MSPGHKTVWHVLLCLTLSLEKTTPPLVLQHLFLQNLGIHPRGRPRDQNPDKPSKPSWLLPSPQQLLLQSLSLPSFCAVHHLLPLAAGRQSSHVPRLSSSEVCPFLPALIILFWALITSPEPLPWFPNWLRHLWSLLPSTLEPVSLK